MDATSRSVLEDIFSSEVTSPDVTVESKRLRLGWAESVSACLHVECREWKKLRMASSRMYVPDLP